MSSHREAPQISKDPVADNTDVYAFVSPDDPSTVTMITNFVPLQDPPGGPNFFEFRRRRGVLDLHRQRRRRQARDRLPVHVRNRRLEPQHVPLQHGPDHLAGQPELEPPAVLLRVACRGRRRHLLPAGVADEGDQGVACPPCNIGPRSTPDYPALGQAAVRTLAGGTRVFAGQRQEGFYVDLGAIFDLGELRPFQHLHLIPSADAVGVDATKTLNVHSIALQVPISSLTAHGNVPANPLADSAVIGVWSATRRRRIRMLGSASETAEVGPWVQVSRLGNPLFNEVIVPMGLKDQWNTQYPAGDAAFADRVQHPELAGLLAVLYPGVFPNLAALSAPRADLVAVLLTGVPAGIVPGFQNYTGPTLADQLRLNVAIPPTTSNPSRYGLLGGDAAGFPNGRRVFDDVVSIELRAVAGLTYPLVDPSYTPDAAAGVLTEGLEPAPDRYQAAFPYLAAPLSGFDVPSS